VAGRAELRCFVEGLHNGRRVPIEMGEYLAIGDGAGDGFAVLINQYGRHADDVGAGAAGVDLLNRVADSAGDAVGVKGPPLCGALGEIAGNHGDGVMATFAMAGKLNTLAVVEEVDVAQIPGGAVGVGVGGLSPLVLSFLMTVATVLRRWKDLGVDEFTGVGGHEGWQEVRVFTEVVVILLHYFRAIGSASGGSLIRFAASRNGSERKHRRE